MRGYSSAGEIGSRAYACGRVGVDVSVHGALAHDHFARIGDALLVCLC